MKALITSEFSKEVQEKHKQAPVKYYFEKGIINNNIIGRSTRIQEVQSTISGSVM